MKSVLIFLGLTSAGFAQWIVNDPANTAVNTAIKANEIANHAEILRQWAQQLEGLNQQLRQLQAQLAEQERIRKVLGDPAAAGAQVQLRDLGLGDLTSDISETLAAVRQLADAVASLGYTANGIYQALGDRTSLGSAFNRQGDYYRRFAAVERQAGNMTAVREQAGTRTMALQADVADTLERLKGAQTQAEVEKLAALLAGLHGQLAVEDARRRSESEQLDELRVLNANQAEKERQDFLERQDAEERESVRAIDGWQQGLKLTPTSYTRP